MRSIRNLRDVVAWRLCVGCGACASFCEPGSVSLVDVEEDGIRPAFRGDACGSFGECLSICPGYAIDADLVRRPPGGAGRFHPLIGHYLGIHEGHAADGEIRHRASSGGILTALALYCLERGKASYVLHAAMDPDAPWRNRTVRSYGRNDLLKRAGSRYAPASPCDALARVEEEVGTCVFIGKPCDTAGLMLLMEKRPKLKEKVALILTFFCAGTPRTRGTLELIESLGIPRESVNDLRYRGNGWPGEFRVRFGSGSGTAGFPYMESWGRLAKQRPYRCMICPDGLGELADISCGDAWHRYTGDGNAGESLVIVRSPRGGEFLEEARKAGYLELSPSTAENLIAGQGLVGRRREVWGRLVGMRLLGVPVPRFEGFFLFRSWRTNSPLAMLRTVAGTVRRVAMRGHWRPRDPIAADGDSPVRRSP